MKSTKKKKRFYAQHNLNMFISIFTIFFTTFAQTHTMSAYTVSFKIQPSTVTSAGVVKFSKKKTKKSKRNLKSCGLRKQASRLVMVDDYVIFSAKNDIVLGKSLRGNYLCGKIAKKDRKTCDVTCVAVACKTVGRPELVREIKFEKHQIMKVDYKSIKQRISEATYTWHRCRSQGCAISLVRRDR